MEIKVAGKLFTRTKFEGLDGKVIVAFTAEDDSFSLQASKMGVEIKGTFLVDGEPELQQFAKLMSDAWSEHRRLKPRIETSLSGH